MRVIIPIEIIPYAPVTEIFILPQYVEY